MAIIPDKKVEQVEFCEGHAPVWTAAPPAAIGLTAVQCSAFTTLTTSARKAYNDAQAARLAYHAAITTQNQAIAAAVNNAADLIRFIKSFAEATSNPNAIYGLAQIPPPATPVPATPPGKPANIAVVLEPSGAITLSWDASNSAAGSGAFFNIARRLPGQSAFTPLGGTSGSTSASRRMSFTDATVPTSAAGAGAQYIIQGQRGTMLGTPSDALVVQFGIDGPGLTFTTMSSKGAKMAA